MEIDGNCAFRAYRPAAWLRVTGEDAATYLQGQFSQDLRGLGPGGSAYGLLLNHKGRIQADAFIVKEVDEAFWLGSYECAGDALRQRLESFIVADDVTVEDQTAEWSGLALSTEPIVQGSGSLPGFRAWEGLDPRHCIQFPGRRSRAPSREFVFDTPEVERELRARLAPAREESREFWEKARITAAIPSVPRDAGPGDLPQEVGLVSAAVSFNKGCYLGQEIMARLKTRGRIRRRLAQVRGLAAVGPGLLGASPAPLHARDRPVGEVRSWAGDIGLAMLPADAAAGARYSLFPSGEALIELTVL